MPFRAGRSSAPVALVLTVLLGFYPGGIEAHDLWLVPDTLRGPDSPVVIRASEGVDFPSSLNAPGPAALERRVLVRPDGTVDSLQLAVRRGPG